MGDSTLLWTSKNLEGSICLYGSSNFQKYAKRCQIPIFKLSKTSQKVRNFAPLEIFRLYCPENDLI